MLKEKNCNFPDSESISPPTNTTPIGFDQIWLEEPELYKGSAIFTTNLPEINNLSTFQANEPKKVEEKIKAHVRGKGNKCNGNLF
jgi:hypothetical protein